MRANCTSNHILQEPRTIDYIKMNKRSRNARRGVSPIIANLIIIAIAVVGSTITAVFAQGLVNTAQISGYPIIEFFQFDGFDARDAIQLKSQIGKNLSRQMSGAFVNDGVKGKGERVVAYVKNNSVQEILISEVRLGGKVFDYTPSSNKWVPLGYYSILTDISPIEKLSQKEIPIIPAGKEVIIVFGLDDNTKIGRNLQFKITTSNGNVITGTIRTGEQKG